MCAVGACAPHAVGIETGSVSAQVCAGIHQYIHCWRSSKQHTELNTEFGAAAIVAAPSAARTSRGAAVDAYSALVDVRAPTQHYVYGK